MRRVAPAAALPVWNDPRYRPLPVIKSQQVSPLPQGAWSPIVTGALPAEAQAQAPPEERGRFVQNTADQPVGSPRAPRTSNRIETGAVDSEPAASKTQSGAQPAPGAAPASSAAPAASSGSEPVVPRQRPLEALPADATAAQQYCFNTADSAADARFAWQAKKIKEMEAELEKRAQQLEAKTEEYKKWLARRDEFSKKAQEKLVAFYAKMRPDAAALQLTAMDDESAAALLTKLEPKVASLVLAEIDPAKAAKIAAVISGAARIPPNRRPRPPAPQPGQQGANQPPPGNGSAATPDSRSRS
jgi:flagellar motility protein MotE (MotC chaperone)